MSDAPSALRVGAISAHAFRNLAPLAFEPGAGINVLSGDNGQGKSNVLEAIFYLGSLGSFRGAPASELIQHGAETAAISCELRTAPLARALSVRLHAGAARRELSLDGKRPRSIAAWASVAPMVVFHPGDLVLGQGAPERRRAFLDRVLEIVDPVFAGARADYERALRSRNRLLRDEAPERAIRAFDPILASSGSVVGVCRARLVDDLAPRAERAFEEIMGAEVPLRLRYAPRVEPTEMALRAALERSLEKDRARGWTAEGPHADDLAVEVLGHAAKHHASQGQHRAMVLALKVAETDELARRSGKLPVLLLDDVSSELDRTRSRRFFEMLARRGGQVFLTTTTPELVALEGQGTFRVHAGAVERVGR